MAGVTASVVESAFTYPLEYLKVREQLALRPRSIKESFSIPRYTDVWFKGCSAFVLGNAVKTVARFQVYNWATKFMADNGSNSPPQIVVAGMITGIAETVLVIPFENIKTTMIEQSSLGLGKAKGVLPPPGSPESTSIEKQLKESTQAEAKDLKKRVRPVVPAPETQSLYEIRPITSMTGTVKFMWEQRKLRAFVQGFNVTVVRQVANSAVRFTAYNSLKQLFVPDESRHVTLGMSVGLAGATGLIEALVTQPIDVVKTRMQSTNGIKLYGNSMICSLRIFMEEGPLRLWAGLVPRWLRMWASGGIMFVVYEQSNRLLSEGMKENPFHWE